MKAIIKKYQKGFIPIIFIIIIIGAVASASATFGVVKYKDEIIANVSNVFKSKIEAPNTELKMTEEPNDVQKLQEQLRITEQKSLEAEKQLAEERARQVAEKTKAEEEARIRAEQEAQMLAEEQKKQEELQNQQQLKIEKCKAEAQLAVDNFKNKLGALYLGQGQEAIKTWEDSILAYKQKYAQCKISIYEGLIGASPELQENAASSCSWYLDEADRLRQELAQKKLQMDSLFEWGEKMGQAEYGKLYLECLNK